MKKILNLSEYIIIFIFRYLIFNFVITLIQVTIYNIFGLLLNFQITYIINFKQLYIVYSIIFIICLFINYIYNLYFIKKLNKSLEKYKGGINDEK